MRDWAHDHSKVEAEIIKSPTMHGEDKFHSYHPLNGAGKTTIAGSTGTGAAIGACVGGPIGAAVGGVIGFIAGKVVTNDLE